MLGVQQGLIALVVSVRIIISASFTSQEEDVPLDALQSMDVSHLLTSEADVPGCAMLPSPMVYPIVTDSRWWTWLRGMLGCRLHRRRWHWPGGFRLPSKRCP